MMSRMMILVTGASTGLGLATADALAQAGHRVVLHARRPDRLTDHAVAERMHALVFGDLADSSAVLDVARQANDLGRFDAVIHNAGVIDGPVTAVNVIDPYLLMAALTPPARSIVLSSGMHRSGSPDLDRAFAGRGDYSTSKLLVTALALTRDGSPPGWADEALPTAWRRDIAPRSGWPRRTRRPSTLSPAGTGTTGRLGRRIPPRRTPPSRRDSSPGWRT